jgi:hypothetical protein
MHTLRSNRRGLLQVAPKCFTASRPFAFISFRHTHTPRPLLFAFYPLFECVVRLGSNVWLFFALHAGMPNREHIPLPYPGLLIRRSGLYMAASSVSVLVCIKHEDRAERYHMIDERARDMETDYNMRGFFFIFWFQKHTTPGGLYLRQHIFPFLPFFLGLYPACARVFTVACLLCFDLSPPLFRDLVFLMWLMLSQALYISLPPFNT